MYNLSVVSRILVAFASGALLAVYFLPAWRIDLFAPQYPEGLVMKIWINNITGDVDVINGLNHYIGMKTISVDMFPEFKYLPYVVAFFITLGMVVAFTGMRKLLFVYLVLTAIGGILAFYDFYKWGYNYGHNLDPKAPIQVPGLSYQPPIIGHKRLLNFDAYSFPDAAGWIVIGAGMLAFGVWFVEWYRAYKQKRKLRVRSTVAVLTMATLFFTACNVKPEPFKLGEDMCSNCRMTITDAKFGGETITKKGKIYKFDDVRCQLQFIKAGRVPAKDIKENLVVNYADPSQFIEVSNAVFIVSDQLKSPMNSNTAAFLSEEAATAINVKGSVRDWNNLSNFNSGNEAKESNSETVTVNQQTGVLKKAIEMAEAYDTIFIQPGIYKEGNLTVTKPITLIGINDPVIDGQNEFETLTITGKDVVVKGLHFKNIGRSSLNDYAAIKVIDAKNVLVEGNKISEAYFAIHLSNTEKCIVRNNVISGTPAQEQTTGNGIHIWKSSHVLVENNIVNGHRDGIYFEFVTNSTIRNNTSTKNIRYGLHFMFSHDDVYTNNKFTDNGAGVAVMYSKNVQMTDNLFDKNWGSAAYGILLKDISDSRITKNNFIQNTVAIFMEGSSRININDNNFRANGWAIKVQASCNDNNFINNNFYSNSFDVATNGTMMLNTFSGNYWDRYEGYDMNKDGNGDVPYHPVSLYAMVVEQNPSASILFRSLMVTLLDRAEKAIPSMTPADLVDEQPLIKPRKL